MIKEIFNYYSRISRKRKAELFFDLLKPQKESILLDAGGGLGTGFRDIWLYFSRVIVVDINKEYIKQINNDKSLNNVIGIVGDVRHLPLEDNSVDYVFSNAVIEHINKRESYLQMRFVV